MAKQVKKKSNNKLLYYALGFLGALILFIIIGKSAGWIGKGKELEVEFAKVKRTSITEKVSASGTVQPVIEVKIAPKCRAKSLTCLSRTVTQCRPERCW